MLTLKNIRKEYVTGDLHQVALDNVSINFKSPALVAILGPSGGGKSTLLNIIGGLDRYDEGDLIINDVSTKNYKDKDWDSYRNHTIGFIFQSYNLIPHQTVLQNVKLALTISGIGSAEAERRALEALDTVGLKDQAHKKPNQMSGGQVQRVAVARALVNNPEIVLADEPTGALDTKTSVQIMELLKEIAKTRLVIMVTHNPDLARDYATRIVRIQDGKILSDSDKVEAGEIEAQHKNLGKASMSFLTSLKLSFNNLRTKKWRTFLTAFAGSIGIIGIALILALSNGVNLYIKGVQEDALSEYPLSIHETGMDLTALMSESMGLAPIVNNDEGKVKETRLLESFLAGTSTNDLASLKKHFDSSQIMKENAKAIEYTYPVTPVIYKAFSDTDIRRFNPDETFTQVNSQSNPFASFLTMGSANIGQFNPLPENKDLYINQYDVVAGRWPENKNELAMVLTSSGTTTDYSLYVLGLKDISELDNLLEEYFEGDQIVFEESTSTYSYEDFLNKEFSLVDPSSLYEFDEERNIYVDKASNKEYLKSVVDQAEKLKVVGVVMPNGTSEASMLMPGLAYTPELVEYAMSLGQKSEIAKKQIENKDINVFTGKEFGEENDPFNMEDIFSIDEDKMSSAFAFDFSALDMNSSSFSGIDFSDVKFDIDPSAIDMSALQNIDYALLLKDINVKVNYPELQQAFNEVAQGYTEYAKNDPSTNYSLLADSIKNYLSSKRAMDIVSAHISSFLEKSRQVLPKTEEITTLLDDIFAGFEQRIAGMTIEDAAQVVTMWNDYVNSGEVREKVEALVDDVNKRYNDLKMSDDDLAAISKDLYEDYEVYAKENFLPEPSKLIDSFSAYIQTEQGKEVFNNAIRKAVNVDEVQSQLQKNITDVMGMYSDDIGKFISKAMEGFTSVMASKLSGGIEDMMRSMSNAFYFNSDAFSDAFNINFDADTLTDLMMSMASSGKTSYQNNLRTLNYATKDEPSSISIYPRDFESKTKIIDVIEKYNKEAKDSGQEDRIVSYSDTVATLMGSVTKIVDTISAVLIAFVAISLIVSSIMIGIITYISVLERTKEIGILRALGASKRNISQVFNAETFIIGFLSGIIGIVTSILIIIPANSFIHNVLDAKNVTAILPVTGAVVLIILSVILTYIGGLIPSRSAAKKDPVEALRTE